MKAKILIALLLCVIVAIAVSACTENTPAETSSNGTTTEAVTTTPVTTTTPVNMVTVTEDYVITISQNANDIEKAVAKDLRLTIKEEVGINISVRDDWLKPGAEIPKLEIVVGKANREDAITLAEGLQENEWKVTLLGNKIYLSGNTAKALAEAADCFLDSFVTGKKAIEIPEGTVCSDIYTLIELSFANAKKVAQPPAGGYPRIYELNDGTMICGIDGYCFISQDGGNRWIRSYDYRTNYIVKNEDGSFPLSCANSAFFQLEDGTLLVAYRATGHIKKDQSVFCTKLLMSQSKDGGKTWTAHSTICEYYDYEGQFKGTWEPHLGLIDGVLTCFYANDHREAVHPTYQNIEYLQYINGEWTNRTIVADGIEHKSRDGMPVWQQLSDGKYVCVIEGWYPGTYELCIQLLWSEDGKKWSTPVTIYRGRTGYAGAPYVVELPTGQLVVVFQCKDNPDGGADFTNDITHMMISDGTPVEFLTAENFSKTENVFGLKEGESGMWNCLYLSSKHLYVASSGVRMKRIPLEELYKQLEK